MIYKNNRLLYVFNILIFIYILKVCGSTVLFHRHNADVDDDFDITTIYRIKDLSLLNSTHAGFMDNYSLIKKNVVIEIHSRTNAIGMPIQDINDIYIMSTNVQEIINFGSFQNNSRTSISYNSRYWNQEPIELNAGLRLQWITTTYPPTTAYYANEFDSTEENKSLNNNLIGFDFKLNYLLQDYSSDDYYNHTIFTFYWTPDTDQTCLSMTYYMNKDYSEYFDYLITLDEKSTSITSTKVKKYEGVTTLKITDIYLKKNQEYKLSLKINIKNAYYLRNQDSFYNKLTQFGLIRISQSSNNYDEEDVRIVSLNNDVHPKLFNILGSYIVRPHRRWIPSHLSILSILGSCLNGGYLIKSTESKCVCPPGFKGQFCETGCGSNSYGSDCKGVCSIRANRKCRGLFMCTNYGCTCPAGLTGPLCNKNCGFGRYGADCKQTCSNNCVSNMCDQYTGVCVQGCSAGYVLPYCRERYPYLVKEPTLLSAEYESIKIELDFQENNINGGDKILKLKYYQLFYKSLIEDTFRSYDIKSISSHNELSTKVIISNLEPDTTYMVGALLFTDDGNFNDQDIKYGQYKTACKQPQITDYNIRLVSGIQSINITWNTVTSTRLECNVTKYVLTLMSNQSKNQISDVQEILSSSDSGHFLDDLLPGFQYNIKLTPSTSYGTLPSSPMYSFIPLMTKNDLQIKDIFTENKNGIIKVYWKLVNSHQYYTTINNEPITLTIRHKLKRILSCSTKELEKNLTTITTFNRTNYEIFDTVPNSQYSIQILMDVKDENTNQQENIIDVLTPASNPKTEPLLDLDHPMYITNNSVFVQWKVDPKNCSKLNGFLSQFYIELKDTVDNILQVEETKNNYLSFNDLKSNTAYELKVFIKTHIGYNPEHFLLVNFTTKFGNLEPVEDLVVYKKSLKNRMVGFRWTYPQDPNLDGFIVSFNENSYINTKNVSIILPQKCSAWPEYYCHTFYNLSPSNNYTFKITPKSKDYPEGGKSSSISFNGIDGLPDSPMNIKTTEVGNTTIALQWDIPWIFNGVLKMFIINAEEISSVDMNTCCVSIAPTEILIEEELPTYNHTITGLSPGSTYSIGVLTVSKSSWYSSPSQLYVTTI